MKTINFVLPVLIIPLAVFSCSRPKTDGSSVSIAEVSKTSVNMIRASAVEDSLQLKKTTEVKKHGPRAFDKYDISFWDSVKMEKRRPEMPRMSVHRDSKHDFNSLKKSELAFKLGALFVGDSLEENSEFRERLINRLFPKGFSQEISDSTLKASFIKVVKETENNNQDGIAAVMVSGYYFEQLLQLTTSEDLPDEKTLALGISKLDSLKSYCNAALLSEPDINMTLPVQRITVYIDTVKNAYKESLSLPDENKFLKLREKIQQTESNIFEESR